MAAYGLDSAVKLASNETPFGPLPGVADAVSAVLGGINRYADHTADAVARCFAHRVGVDRDHVAVGPGAVGLLEQLALAVAGPGDEVVYPWPSFIAYPQFTGLAGATPVAVPLVRQRFDTDAVIAAMSERTMLVLLANPNNPTSTALTATELDRIVDAAPEQCLVVIDEAYREFVTDVSVPDAIARYADRPNVAVLRSMSKAYGLAGLRVGFLVADPLVIAAVDACATPFGVNAAGQAGALAAFEQDDEVRRRCAIVVAERDRVARALRHLGVGVPVSHGNFWWLAAGSGAHPLAEALERRGVVTRPLDGGVRVTVGTPAENDRFLAALEACLNDAPDLLSGWTIATGQQAQRAARWLDRLESAMTRLASHLDREHPGRTAPVPGEDETWDAGQVWAHVAEFGQYWLGQLTAILDAASTEPVPFGRTRRDAGRIEAIERGRHDDPAEHLAVVTASAGRLAELLAGMTNEDWERAGVHETLGVMDLDDQLRHFHVGHYEEHADQLDSILHRSPATQAGAPAPSASAPVASPLERRDALWRSLDSGREPTP
jgi:histidinol-phosphate aminotransferase